MNKSTKTLKQVRELYHGKSGDIESESILVDANADKKDGFITIWSDNNDIAKILDRCSSMVLEYKEQGGGYSIKINRKAFRGLSYAFKRVDNKLSKDGGEDDIQETEEI